MNARTTHTEEAPTTTTRIKRIPSYTGHARLTPMTQEATMPDPIRTESDIRRALQPITSVDSLEERGEGEYRLAVDADQDIEALRAALTGCRVEWMGEGNTGSDGESTEDVSIVIAGLDDEEADPCPWTSADECHTAQERSVAGSPVGIPDCPEHGLILDA